MLLVLLPSDRPLFRMDPFADFLLLRMAFRRVAPSIIVFQQK